MSETLSSVVCIYVGSTILGLPWLGFLSVLNVFYTSTVSESPQLNSHSRLTFSLHK